MSKRGLGRGLSALIPSASQESHADEDIIELPVDLIAPNPEQPRTDISEESVDELADSIKKVGLLQPIIVRPLGDTYQIIAGERRWRAARRAGLEKIPVRVLPRTEVEALELALIENLQREDLNPIEEARGYKRLLSEHHMTQAELADKVSKSRSTITNALRLLDLPDEVQEMVYKGTITAGHARAILSVPDDASRVRLASKIAEEGLSVREAENLARLIASGQEHRGARTVTPRSFKVAARLLRRHLGTNVRVRAGKDRNKVEIEFRSEEELDRIVRLLTRARGEEGA